MNWVSYKQERTSFLPEKIKSAALHIGDDPITPLAPTFLHQGSRPSCCAAGQSPEVLEPIRGQFRIKHGVLDVPMSHIRLNGSRVLPLRCEVEAASVPELMRVDWEADLRELASPRDHLPTVAAAIGPLRSEAKM
jgi:hypothetical protein